MIKVKKPYPVSLCSSPGLKLYGNSPQARYVNFIVHISYKSVAKCMTGMIYCCLFHCFSSDFLWDYFKGMNIPRLPLGCMCLLGCTVTSTFYSLEILESTS